MRGRGVVLSGDGPTYGIARLGKLWDTIRLVLGGHLANKHVVFHERERREVVERETCESLADGRN